MNTALKDKETQAPAGTKCACCGATHDVVIRLEYIGGKGYTEIAECRNRPWCWRRQDEQMGIVKVAA